MTKKFVYDLAEGLSQVLSDGTNTYVYGPGGVPVEQINGSTVTYLHQDQLGSTRVLTNQTANVVATYSYDPYGKATKTGTASTPMQYAGQYNDAESGLYWMRARSYDPNTGSFITVDPMLPMTGSAYGYASGDPVNNTDPLGLFTIPGTGICVAIADPSCDNSANAAWAGNVYAGIGNALTFGQGVNLAARARGYGGGFTADCADTGFGAYIGGEIGGTVLQSVFFGAMPKAAPRAFDIHPLFGPAERPPSRTTSGQADAGRTPKVDAQSRCKLLVRQRYGKHQRCPGSGRRNTAHHYARRRVQDHLGRAVEAQPIT